MKIYTKTGDDGTTGLFGGSRISKASDLIEALGTVDELNAATGFCRAVCDLADLDAVLEAIQNRLFDIGSELASPGTERFRTVSENDANALEESIDSQTAELPPLRNFILPGGSELAARLHLARSICRRAERALYRLHELSPLRQEILIYFNRLSDWLFVAARTANARNGVSDIAWRKREDR